MDDIIHALKTLRVPLGQGEYDIHSLVAQALMQHGLAPKHEVSLGARRRIDFLVGTIGIEVKRGRPQSKSLMLQISKYLASDALSGLVLVVERNATVPGSIHGKPVKVVSLNRLWGISL